MVSVSDERTHLDPRVESNCGVESELFGHPAVDDEYVRVMNARQASRGVKR